jgi:hypothetical protein
MDASHTYLLQIEGTGPLEDNRSALLWEMPYALNDLVQAIYRIPMVNIMPTMARRALTITSLIVLLATIGFWAQKERDLRISQPLSAKESSDAYSGNGYEFRYPRDWHVSPIREASSTATSLYVSKYSNNDEYGLSISNEGTTTLAQLLRELKASTAFPVVEGILEGEPTVNTLSYFDGQVVFEEALLCTSDGLVSIKVHHSLEDTERHAAFNLAASTLRKVN